MTYKIKRFSKRRDAPKKWNLSVTPVNIKINIEESKNFTKQLSYCQLTTRELVYKFIKDIKNGYMYEDGPSGGDTHYLKEFSKPNNPIKERRFLMYSKSLNYHDRFNYRIYEPMESEEGNVSYKIVIDSIEGHNANSKNYSEYDQRRKN